MIHIPVLRWGEPYKSLEADKVVHFTTGEVLAEVSRANGGLIERDMRLAKRARDVLREIPIANLMQMMKKAADLYTKAELPLGDGTQTPEQFVHMQSATTGLPEHMCRFNMEKNHFVLNQMDRILDCLTRGLDLNILSRGYGMESRGVPVSYQAQSPVLGMVLPSNSPGVHTLWLPIIPLQIGLVLKPGPQEPWTPYRMAQAFIQAGVPKQAIAIYPGLGDVGAAVLASCPRSLIFGGTATVEQYKGNPRVQAHGPGFSKILLGDDKVDDWRKYLDIMVDSVLINSGRGCINCSGIWASRHTEEIADGHRRADGADSTAAARRSEGRSRRVHRSRPGRRRVRRHRQGREGAGHEGHDREVRPAAGEEGALRLSAADGPTVRFAGTRRCQEGIHVPLLHRRQVSAGEDAGVDRPDAGVHAPSPRTRNSSKR